MKTVIEWYKKATFEMLKHKENLSDEMFLQNMLNVHLRAKEMEKQQMFDYIKKNYVNGENSLKFHQEEFEKYYNETFKTK